MLRSTSGFRPLPEEPRVRCEPGAEPLGRQAAAALPRAVAVVESAQCAVFARPVVVYVCADSQSFRRHTASSVGGGVMILGRLFLSPRLARAPERVPRILTHELSHLHLEQRAGARVFAGDFPAWFTEGLATWVSAGGGAENVSEAQARQAILEGRCMRPDLSNSLLRPQDASTYRLAPHMFYRQGAMFVGYLAGRDPQGFRKFLAALESGSRFAPAFRGELGLDSDDAWSRFVEQLRAESRKSPSPTAH
ncbi:MAG: hypothetical protein HZB25_04400 [Candidatus Eisenbacteria bacterium]|nr:hypothetical protein [Candidatus Eisenbacteria bacterium]